MAANNGKNPGHSSTSRLCDTGQYSLQAVSSGSARPPVLGAIVGMTSHGIQRPWH